MGLGFWILLILFLILLVGFSSLYSICTKLRNRNHGLKRDRSRAILRSNRWKHYAHVLEIRAFEAPMGGMSPLEREANRTAFRARYINDFQGWGDEHDETQAIPTVHSV